MSRSTVCTRCLLPATYPHIRFDHRGVCRYCNGDPEFEDVRKHKAELDRLIADARGRTPRYDAIVAVSGGKDSSYAAYYLKKEYGLKLLGVNYDIGYPSDMALRNLNALADRLDMDLLTIRPNPGLIRRLFARFLRRRGEFCSVCTHIGYIIMAGLALRERRLTGVSPLMVGGWSKRYEYQPGVSAADMKTFFSHLDGKLLEELKTSPFVEPDVLDLLRHMRDPRQAMAGTGSGGEIGEAVVRGVQLPDYIEWDVLAFPEILRREIGWRQPENVHDSHFDCTLFPVKEFLKYRKYGLTQETIKNSRLIREGKMTREQGLERARREQTTEPPALSEFLRQLGVERDEVAWDADWSAQ